MNFFSKIGHGLKVAATDTGKAAEAVGKKTLKVAEVAAPVLPDVLAFTPAAPAAPFLAKCLPFLEFDKAKESTVVNPLETMGVTIALGVIVQSVHNPQHAAVLKDQLLGLARIIEQTYAGQAGAGTATPQAH